MAPIKRVDSARKRFAKRVIFAPAWVGPRELRKIRGPECFLCHPKENEVVLEHPLERDAFHKVWEPMQPWCPKHVIIAPHEHYRSITDLSQRQFEGFVNVLRRVLSKTSKAYLNEGRVAGQSQPHLHTHVVEDPRGSPSQLLSTKAQLHDDYASRISAIAGQTLVQAAGQPTCSFLDFVTSAKVTLSRDDGMITLHYRNFDELSRKGLGDLNRLHFALKRAHYFLKRQIGQDGLPFGLNYLLARKRKGVDVSVLPRASNKDLGGLEVFEGIKLSRTVEAPPDLAWAKASRKFKQKFLKQFKGRPR